MKTMTDLEAAMMLIDILYERGLINRATWEAVKEKTDYPDGCCCHVEQKPARRNGIEQVYETKSEETAVPISECDGCPYGRDSPCIGWCTKEIMRTAGLPKERERHHV